MSNSKYQPEIDGLRAIAVLSVILYHINELWLPGGFIGVDIFFVLSGYLITSNIYPQIENETFSFKNFYNRRIKRLLPSLYLVLIFCSILGYFLLISDDIGSLNHSLRKIIVFWGNHYFAEGKNYFSPVSNEIPFLHTWSLAVEEQFYFVWPICIFLSRKIGFKKNGILIFAFVAMFFSFLLASLLIFQRHQSWAYYSFPTRYGELLIGALLAISQIKQKSNSPYFSLTGLSLIFLSFVLINGTSHFPGVTALVPCLGTLLILYSTKNFLTRWLAFSPMVFIGKISYQLYLWHWPILAYFRYATGHYFLSNTIIIVSLVTTFLLSVLSWKYIEAPIRYNAMEFKKTFSFLYIVPTAIVLLLIKFSPHFTFKSKLLSNPSNSEELTSYGENICHGTIETRKCLKGANKPAGLLVMGDSHAAHLNSFIDTLGKEQNWAAFVASSSSCSPVLEFDQTIMSKMEDRKNCENLKNYFLSEIDKYQNIAIASRWDFQLGFSIGQESDPNYISKLKKTFDLLLAKKKSVYVFSQVPLLVISPERAELLSTRFGFKTSNDANASVLKANQIVRDLVSKYPNITWIDISAPLLNFDNGVTYKTFPVYKDNNHLNIFGATELAHQMNKQHSLDFFKKNLSREKM